MTKKEPPLSHVRARALIHMPRMLAASAGPPTADAGVDAAVAFNDAPDANVVVSERHHGDAVVDPMPRPAAGNANVSLKGTCSKGAATINVYVGPDWTPSLSEL